MSQFLTPRGNLVRTWTDDNGVRWAQSTLGTTYGQEPPQVPLPEGMPDPPSEVETKLPIGNKGYPATCYEGRRRPWGYLLDPHLAVLRWEKRDRGFNIVRRIMFLHWLTCRQLGLWYRQFSCPYCGVSVGLPCRSRSIRWKDGDIACSNNIADSAHKLRRQRSDPLLNKAPVELLPDWSWWAPNATGEDPSALSSLLAATRGLDFTATYIESFAP